MKTCDYREPSSLCESQNNKKREGKFCVCDEFGAKFDYPTRASRGTQQTTATTSKQHVYDMKHFVARARHCS